MNWRDFIIEVYADAERAPGIRSKPDFRPPALSQDFAELESLLKVLMPLELRSLFLDSNGVMSMLSVDDGDWFEDMWLFWPISDMVKQNLRMRWATMHPYDDNRRYCPRGDDLLFFASNGADGTFAHPINAQGVVEPSVFVWTPIGDELTLLASSLKEFVRAWLTGQARRT
ncbi:MAG: SMI1/KNR4 family protein [Planctomycetes bacterium]|nr:SMI1/KNR4 family protein [Planctomycetota bacterium]